MENEVWKDIGGYEGLYQVSNLGRVKSLERKVLRTSGKLMRVRERILKTYSCRGYVYVDICKNSIFKKCKIHRLVAVAFLPNPNNLPQVNHKNEILSDNRVDNLEWCTPKYNANYGTVRERISRKVRNHANTSIHILQFNLDGSFVKEWPSVREIERACVAKSPNVCQVCKGVYKTAKGFIWRYK